MSKKQDALLIIMNAIDCRDQHIALLYKCNDKFKNTIEIEPIENISNIIEDITDNYNDDLVNEKDSKSLLSLVAFTDVFDDEESPIVLYQSIIDGLKQNMLE